MKAGTSFGRGGEDGGIGREGGTTDERVGETGKKDERARGERKMEKEVEKEGQIKGPVQTDATGQMGELAVTVKCFDMLCRHTNTGTCTR